MMSESTNSNENEVEEQPSESTYRRESSSFSGSGTPRSSTPKPVLLQSKSINMDLAVIIGCTSCTNGDDHDLGFSMEDDFAAILEEDFAAKIEDTLIARGSSANLEDGQEGNGKDETTDYLNVTESESPNSGPKKTDNMAHGSFDNDYPFDDCSEDQVDVFDE